MISLGRFWHMKPWSQLTQEEKADLEQRHLRGEFDRRRLIRFGYLSAQERNKLREKYHNLDDRFEPDSRHIPEEVAVGVFVVFMFGFLLGTISGKEVTVIECILVAVLYWLCAAIVLRGIHKARDERARLYDEWRHD
jgi:hypothetical protein